MCPKLSNNLVAGLLLFTLAASGGCAVAAGGIVPSVAGASPVVVENLGSGRGDSFWLARYDDVVEAALRAGDVLSLELTEQEIGEDRATLRYADAQGVQITLRIERRTDSVTRLRFTVSSGRFTGLASLLGRQIIDELNDADAFLVDWTVKTETGLE